MYIGQKKHIQHSVETSLISAKVKDVDDARIELATFRKHRRKCEANIIPLNQTPYFNDDETFKNIIIYIHC